MTTRFTAIVLSVFLFQLAVKYASAGTKVRYQLLLEICDEMWAGSDAGIQVILYDKEGNSCSSPVTNSQHKTIARKSKYVTQFECDSDGNLPRPKCKKQCDLHKIKISQDGHGIADGLCFNTIIISDFTRSGIVFAQQNIRFWLDEEDKQYTMYPQWSRRAGIRPGGNIMGPGKAPGQNWGKEEVKEKAQKWGVGCMTGPGTGQGIYRKC